MTLGPPIRDEKPEPPDWKPHESDKRFEVDAQGKLRTKIPPPPLPTYWEILAKGLKRC